MNQNKALELTKDIATDIIGGILIAVGVYNFAAAAKFPMVGVNGIALIFYQLFGLPIGTVALILNIPIAILFSASGPQIFPEFSPDDHHYFHNHGRDRTAVPGLSG